MSLDDTVEEVAVEADTAELDIVDPTLNCHERTLAEMWQPMADPADSAMRDAIWGSSPEEHQSMVDYEIAARESEHLAAQTARQAYLSKMLWGEVQSVERLSAATLRAVKKIRQARSQATTHIHRDSFFKIYEGILLANHQGFVFNVEITISWERGGYRTPEQVNAGFEAFLHRLRKFAEHREIELRYYAVFENGAEVGYHSHFHMCFPHCRRKELRAWLAIALRAADGRPFPKTDYKINIHKDHHVSSQWFWFRYLMKGVDPKLSRSERRLFGGDVTLNSLMGLECRDTGLIEIKRVRCARSIDDLARTIEKKKNRYYQEKDFCAMSERERYSDTEYQQGFVARRLAEMQRALDSLDDI